MLIPAPHRSGFSGGDRIRRAARTFSKAAFTVLVVSFALFGFSAEAAITIDNKSGTVMYTDLGNGLNATYLVFQISSDTSEADVWVELDDSASTIIQNVGSGVHQLKFLPGPTGQPPVADLGLEPGETKGVFFLVSASSTTAVPQALTINVYDGEPGGGGTLIGAGVFMFTVEDTIQANANKVNTVVTVPDDPTLGQLGTITVTGCTGVVGSDRILYFTPVSSSDWPADTFEFVDSEITLPGYAGSPYRNVAKIPVDDVVTSDTCYTEVFRFVINGQDTASTTPANYISSGTQVKHTTNDSGSFIVFIPPAECSEITISHNPTPLPEGTGGVSYGPVQFSATGGTGNFTFVATGLPTGLTMSTSGVLSGTTNSVGLFNFAVTATEVGGDPADCQEVINLQLIINCPNFVVTPSSLPSGTVDSPYNVQLSATGGVGPYTFAVSGGVLPAGITLSTGGLLSGTPTATGNFPIDITVTDTQNESCQTVRAFSVFRIDAAQTEPVPTLSEIGLIAMIILLAGVAFFRMRS